MVGRLVQNQQVRRFQQQPCNGKPCLFAAAESGDHPVIGLLSESHTVEDGAYFHVDLIAVVVLEPGLQAVVLLCCRHIPGLHLLFQLVQAFLGVQQRTEHAAHLRPDRAFPIQTAHLFQVADTGLGGLGNLAVALQQMVGQFLSRQNAQQGRFSAAVHTHKPDPVVVFYRQRDVGENLSAIIKFMDICHA